MYFLIMGVPQTGFPRFYRDFPEIQWVHAQRPPIQMNNDHRSLSVATRMPEVHLDASGCHDASVKN